MDMPKILAYLSDLEANNDRDWYHAHKDEYKKANAAFEDLTQALLFEIGTQDDRVLRNSPKDLTFRLARDTRFSHDKSPYNPSFRAHISPAGKPFIPVGFFISLRPGDRSFLGGGLFASSFKDATALIRDSIVQHGEEFERIVTAPEFTANFTVLGEALKNVPKGYDPAHPQARYLKNKSWYLQYPAEDSLLLDTGRFVRKAGEIFSAMQPFNAFLNRALATFQMPER